MGEDQMLFYPRDTFFSIDSLARDSAIGVPNRNVAPDLGNPYLNGLKTAPPIFLKME
jgi:hypothetical protein